MSNNPFLGIRIEYHILQSFPVTCLNRDDVGAPKTAIVGGVTRARVSSQCWKRQVRVALHELGVKIAIRSKRIDSMIEKFSLNLGASIEQASKCAQKIAEILSKDTLLFFSENEAQALADYAQTKDWQSDKLAEKEIIKFCVNTTNKGLDNLDIALFGRMVAKAADMNIEAASSFSHAISTHRVVNEIEMFTAMDDLKEEQGSAHMGSLEFNSATYYRYISLDLGQLASQLAAEDIPQAVEVFTKALFIAVPSARQTTQSGACLWDYARVLVRKGQRFQANFETPTKRGQEGGYLQNSIKDLNERIDGQLRQMGSMAGVIDQEEGKADFYFGQQNGPNIDELIEKITCTLPKVS